MKKKRILLAAGGTGGHMFPAQALSEVLLKDGRFFSNDSIVLASEKIIQI